MQRIKLYRKKPLISYAGSLIQQSHGESIHNHGILKWNLNNKTNELIEIHNDVGYFTIHIDNNIFPDIKSLNLPKFPHIRLITNNVSISKLEKYVIKLKTEYDVKSLSIIKNSNKDEHTSVTGMSLLGSIAVPEYQDTLISQYLTLHSTKLTPNLLTLISQINQKLNQKLGQETQPTNKWKIKELWFSNLFCFGEDNYINFESLNGIYGLYSQNKTGKSSILDIILFLLFDKSSRANKGIDFLNIDKDQFYCKIKFELDGIFYFIEKTGYRRPSTRIIDRVTVKTNFWKEDLSGNITNLNDDQRRSTNLNIQDIIGQYETIILTSISLQNNNAGLIEKTQSERKNILSSFLGIDIFEKLYQLANLEAKKINALVGEYKNQHIDTNLFNLQNEYLIKSNEILTIEGEIEQLELQQHKLTNNIIDLNSNIHKINDTLNIDTLNDLKISLENTITKLQSSIQELSKIVDDIMSNAKKIATQLAKIKLSDYELKINQLNQFKLDKQKLLDDINILSVILTNQQDKLKNLDLLEYDPNCKYCMNNIFVKDAINTKQEVEKNLILQKQYNDQLTSIDKKIQKLLPIELKYNNILKLIEYKEKLKQSYTANKSALDVLIEKLNNSTLSLTHTNKDIDLYNLNQQAIETNKKLKQQIATLTIELEKNKQLYKSKNEILLKLKSSVQLIHDKQKTLESNLLKLQSYEEEYLAYEYYMKATHRDGIQYELIKKILPIFEQEINNILSQIVDFKTLIYIDDKNIEMNIAYGDKTWPLKLTSGMEKFISSIAIRVALTKIANIAKPNFLIIDEGMGNLDSDNLNNIPILFNFLKNEFDFVFVISHLAIMRDMTDKILELNISSKYSSIKIL